MTVLGAVSVSGWVAVMSVEAATDGDTFSPSLSESCALCAGE